MESQYEKQQTHKNPNNKDYIDFYRSNQIQIDEAAFESTTHQKRSEQFDIQEQFQIQSSAQFKGNRNKKTMNAYDYNHQNEDNKINQKDQKSNENRRLSQEKYSNRQLSEGREGLLQRQIESNNRNLAGAKTSLNTQNQAILKQDREANCKEIVVSDQRTLAISTKNLAKSNSQNRLLFTSPDSLQNKNQEFSGDKSGKNQQDKISFDSTNADKRELLFNHHKQSNAVGLHKNGNDQVKQNHNNPLSNCSTKECTFCKTKGTHSVTLGIPPCTAIYCKQDQTGLMMQNGLSKKYSTNRDYYNVKIVNDLIYNENTHIVSIFKDYLILDDINEFLKRTYNYQETKVRLPKLCSFYDKYSQVFPNYVVLPESKYMFKNIQRKQKLIDEQYQLQEEQARKQHQTLLDEDKLFSSKFYNSMMKNDISMNRQQYEEQAKQISVQGGKKVGGRIQDWKIEDLVDRFILKDSESNIQLHTTNGLDFSQSIIMQDKTPEKIQMSQQKGTANRPQMIVQKTNSNNGLGQKKVNQQQETIRKPSQITPIIAMGATVTNLAGSGGSSKRQKGSFNQQNTANANKFSGTMPKLDNKAQMLPSTQVLQSTSAKNTPRLNNKGQRITQDQQQMQASPATKEALNTYLHNCQIDLNNEENKNIMPPLENSGKILDYESPNMKMLSSQSYKNLLISGSQTILAHQQLNNLTGSISAVNNNRQVLKSQCTLPTAQQQQNNIANLKKNQRVTTGAQKSIAAKKALSPNPQVLCSSQQQPQNASRNLGGQNSTQKSIKSVNSHAKYLSNDNQYQKMLVLPAQAQTFASQETVNSMYHDSSNKKNAFSSQKPKKIFTNVQQMDQIKENQERDFGDIITGEDCDDAGIADERFASPDVFKTQDNVRRSVESRKDAPQMNPILLTSQDDKMMLSQYTNYDQIKKHLEQYITGNQIDSNSSLPGGPKVIYSKGSEYKNKHNNNRSNSGQRNHVISRDGGSVNNDSRTLRNTAQPQKHYESLKQRIRDEVLLSNTCKTPNKISSKGAGMFQQNPNRMSIEPKDIILTKTGIQGCLSSTSANERALSFSQTGFSNPNNYRSITNLQQRKSSNQPLKDSINESKRLSQNRQSFKEMSQSEQQKIIKKSATGKNLQINEVNQHTFGSTQPQSYLKQVSSATTLMNPTFISSSTTNQSNKLQPGQPQAANTVRVMTPSYSLVSLSSKMVSPTTSTSPLTMTVTLAGSGQGRKQQQKKAMVSAATAASHHQLNSNGIQNQINQQTFTLADKNQKIITTQKSSTQQSGSKINNSKTTKQQILTSVALGTNQGRKQVLQQSSSAGVFQTTPRGQVILDQARKQYADQMLPENSQNLSCTVSTEHNSGNKKGIGAPSISSQGQQYDLKQKQKIQTTSNQNQHTYKKGANGISLATSSSVTHFKSPSQQIQPKRAPASKNI